MYIYYRLWLYFATDAALSLPFTVLMKSCGGEVSAVNDIEVLYPFVLVFFFIIFLECCKQMGKSGKI